MTSLPSFKGRQAFLLCRAREIVCCRLRLQMDPVAAVRSDLAQSEEESLPPSELAAHSAHLPGFESQIRAEHQDEAARIREMMMGQVRPSQLSHVPPLVRPSWKLT
jgi:hypothetical protein